MILDEKPLSMCESKKYIQKDKDILGFLKKFNNLKPEEGEELRKKLGELGVLKIKDSQISKIIDVLPEDKEDLVKIFADVDLEDEEVNKILGVIKEFK